MPEENTNNLNPNQTEHGIQPVSDPSKLPAPTFQPADLPNSQVPRFSSTEIFWWNNGIWGQSGYAIPNAGGKFTTKNRLIHDMVTFLGRELFYAMHRPDVKFSRPPNSEWLHAVAKMIRLGRKRMADRSIGWNDERKGDADHNTAGIANFIVFPVPYFGGRVRQAQASRWCRMLLVLLGEMMQHSDNDFDDDITDFFASKVDETLSRIQTEIATMFLGVTREEAEADTYTLPAVIDDTNYNPDALFTEAEMTDERPPTLWWPTSNDLSPISGLDYAIAYAHAMRWPVAGEVYYGDYGNYENAFPGIAATGKVNAPGSQAAEKANSK